MKSKTWTIILILSILLLAVPGGTGAQGPAPDETVGLQTALGTAFTYQGYLTDSDDPADGAYDMQFALYDALSGGTQVGSTLTEEGTDVSDGVFTVQLDFGTGAFDGDARYLEVGVRANGSAGLYTILLPRQALTAAPYALHAAQVPWSGVDSVPADLADGDDDTTYDTEIEVLEQRILLLECLQGYGDCKFVFLTHDGYFGHLVGGLVGGDAICQSAAEAAGLPGTYKAWLSDDSASPSTRFTRATVPYIMPNGTWIARDWSDLTDGSLLAPIDHGPDGEPVQLNAIGYDAWTATKADGTPDTFSPIRDCMGWEIELWDGMLGCATATDGNWSYKGSLSCNNLFSLYCFQQ